MYCSGLGAKYMFNDTFALIDEDGLVKLDERAEKIAFDYDYLYSIRNMDPEEIFDSGEICYFKYVMYVLVLFSI